MAELADVTITPKANSYVEGMVVSRKITAVTD